MPTGQLIVGDVRDALESLPDDSIHCVVTSPPYWGLRVYAGLPSSVWGGSPECQHKWQAIVRKGQSGGSDPENSPKQALKGSENYQRTPDLDQAVCLECAAWRGTLGNEPTLEMYVRNITEIFDLIRRKLHPSGTVWLNLGDCYAGGGRGGNPADSPFQKQATNQGSQVQRSPIPTGCKPKDLVGLPWLIAFALRGSSWWLRSDIIWAKPNPMPESITDRPTRSHEYIFLLAKTPRYFYDGEAIKEPYADSTIHQARSVYRGRARKNYSGANAQDPSESKRRILESVRQGGGRNKRDVWWITKQGFSGAHFATYPVKLVEPCVKAGSSEGGVCSRCLAPRVRVVERDPIPDEIKKRFEEARQRSASATGRTDGHTNYKPNWRRGGRTVGWRWSCDCATTNIQEGEPSTIPATVLDPFSGSGTTGLVALSLGRSYIGVDADPTCAPMAQLRIQQAVGYSCTIVQPRRC